jgi:hypothetical protein
MARIHRRDIGEVQALFDQWRQTRKGKARIPDELWAAAVEVARRNGCNRTAAALRLDGGKLRRQMVAAGPARVKQKKTPPPAFLELVAAAGHNGSEYTIEVEGRAGILRIHCKGASTAELAALCKGLWSATFDSDNPAHSRPGGDRAG